MFRKNWFPQKTQDTPPPYPERPTMPSGIALESIERTYLDAWREHIIARTELEVCKACHPRRGWEPQPECRKAKYRHDNAFTTWLALQQSMEDHYRAECCKE